MLSSPVSIEQSGAAGGVQQPSEQRGLLADGLSAQRRELVVAPARVVRGGGVVGLGLGHQLVGHQPGEGAVERARSQPYAPVGELVDEAHDGVPVAVPGGQGEQHLEAGRGEGREGTCRTHAHTIQSDSGLCPQWIYQMSETGVVVITRVSKVVVPVDDQQAALDFWTTSMGFDVVTGRPLRRRAVDRGQAAGPGPAARPQPATGGRAPPHRARPPAALGPVLRLCRHRADLRRAEYAAGCGSRLRRPGSTSAGGRCSRTTRARVRARPVGRRRPMAEGPSFRR